ncbi:hypothetical protein [Flavobacterium fluviale]|uniref:CarboxypepD_reg-like domain-containing protein n=1 Tax=Flavobacterium fluviale TaxID=2249356 RepID=A0A344LTV0_9FLAO|nr:hypothetical protein [Flavobacterium fluviale]AXB57342.1 hypothetical protein HYN86_12375 [Flavobacterium fluviale]
MNKEIKISLIKPCHESWSKMTTNEKNKFCNVCQKNVFDFTKASNLEIINIFNKNQNLCGRFNPSQLNKNLEVTKQKKTFWITVVASLTTFFGIGNHIVKAQVVMGIATLEPKLKKIHVRKIFSSSDSIGSTNKLNQNKICSGIVHNKNNVPLSGVLILNERNKKVVKTNEMGNFSISLEENNDTLICLDTYNNYDIMEDAIITITIMSNRRKEYEDN